MKFSEMLTEYLDLREEQATADDSWTPIARRGDRRNHMNELLEGMDAMIDSAPPTGGAEGGDAAGVQGMSLQAKALRDPPEIVQAEYDRMVVRSAMRQATSALERLLAGTDKTVTDRQAGRSAIEALRVAEQHVRGVNASADAQPKGGA